MSRLVEAIEKRNDFRQVRDFLSSKVTVNPENISHFAHPIVNFIFEEKPDYVIACDRGARLIGLATHMLYKELYGSFPTRDHSISFRKISRKIPTELVRDQIEEDIKKVLKLNKEPKVFILDDWMYSGKTKKWIEELIDNLSDGKATVLFGLMVGGGNRVDISGDRHSFAYCDKRNRDQERGVYYDSEMKPHRNESLRASLQYKRKISQKVKNFAREIRGKD